MLLLFLGISSYSFAQKKEIKTANEAYKNKDYFTSGEYYRIALSSSKLKLSPEKLAELHFRYAESSRHTYNFTRACKSYKKVLESGHKDRFAYIDYHYAYSLKHIGKYEEAAQEFEAFLNTESTTGYEQKLHDYAKQELIACRLSVHLKENPDNLMDVKQINDYVNTKHSDFAPHHIGNDLYYSSLMHERQLERGRVRDDGGAFANLVGKVMYSKNMANKDEEPSRGSQVPNKAVNIKFENSGNSTLSTDGQWMYYTKCKPVENKMVCKLFKIKKLDGPGRFAAKALELPVNINTPEATCTHPRLGFDSTLMKEVLFFVSDRDGGQGGLDIWKATVTGENTYSDPVNLGPLVNSRDDEATPFFHNTTQSLYFSSKWHPGLGGYDIFKSDYVNGDWTEPRNVGIPLNSAANDLYFIINTGDTTGYFASNRPGSTTLVGESCCNDIYSLVLPKLPLSDMPELPEIIAMNDPEPEPEPDPIPEPEPTPEPEPEPEPTPEPEPIPEPEPDPEPIVTPELDITELEQNALDELNSMLPLSLYFHNDQPDPGSRKETTTVTYSKTYNRYTGMEELYVDEHTAQYKREERPKVQKKIEKFFEKDIRANYAKMNDLFEELQKALDGGVKLQLAIRGYTSPRASSEYNKRLAHRRISSVRNELSQYKDAVLLKYIQSGALKIVELPLGETKVPEGVSDDIHDPRNSIYSVDASSQRKVNFEVVELERKELKK
ncbi:MAG: hypothetical protein GY810_31870 [Aureispira sp.]|nr:hypothetical protein [Aureispira sp.]